MAIPETYPRNVRQALARLLDELAPAAPEPAALVIYGSLAKGSYRAGESDVNLAVVLESASREVLSSIGAPLRAAWRAVRVEPFIVLRTELPHLLDVFPIKLSDIQAHHQVITGEDPFIGLAIDDAHLRLRVEQELRNHLLRLRRHYVFAGSDARALARMLFKSASSLGIELGALLRLAGKPEDSGRLDSVVRAAADAFELDHDALARLCAFKQGKDVDDVHALYLDVMRAVEHAVARADAPVMTP